MESRYPSNKLSLPSADILVLSWRHLTANGRYYEILHGWVDRGGALGVTLTIYGAPPQWTTTANAP